jgi:serine 3-dehydrogenase
MRMTPLSGQTMLITGATSGIGAACAEAFAGLGMNLLLCARREDRLHAFAKHITSIYDVNIHAFKLDVRKAGQVAQHFHNLPPEWQAIDVLVNNAGLALGLAEVYETQPDHLETMIDTNVKGLLYVTQQVVPGMVERGRGHVINIGSIAGRYVYPNGGVYCATKFAVHALTQGLKMDLHGTPVRVSTVDPGLVETEFSQVRFEGDAERAAQVYAGMTPLTAADVADAVVYCATRPPHVNISEMLLMPTDQSGPTMVHRRT